MYKCPDCNIELDESIGFLICRKCEKKYGLCANCKKVVCHDDLKWQQSRHSPQYYSVCPHCKFKLRGSEHVYKSDIYKHYNFAFKFVNRMNIPYPMYFNEKFPFGEIQEDWGNHHNDFRYKETNAVGFMMGTDWGTSRAYKVKFNLDDDEFECVALSHESGLEVFLIAAGTLIGLETSKFVLKRSLETIEKKINNWWKTNKDKNWKKDESDEPLVVAIQVRTPSWEIQIDGKFTKEEREKILDFIQQQNKPKKNLDEFLESLPIPELNKKIKSASKEIVKRK